MNDIIPAHSGADVLVAGDFNIWDPDGDPGAPVDSPLPDDGLSAHISGVLGAHGLDLEGPSGQATHSGGHGLDRIYATAGLLRHSPVVHDSQC